MDVSPDESMIAAGFKNGTVRVYDYIQEQVKLKKVWKCCKEWVSDLKFSPNGKFLAIGSHDNAIYIYTVPELKPKFKMNKHSSYITHLDWAEDSLSLHSNCGAYELLFWNALSG